MHRHAELGIAAHWRYKEGGDTPAAFDQKIQFLRQLLEPGDKDGDLLDQLHGDVFEDRVYAVSPKGDVVEMPQNATPLDFAYHVHTQIGHRCRGAKANGRIVPLTYKNCQRRQDRNNYRQRPATESRLAEPAARLSRINAQSRQSSQLVQAARQGSQQTPGP